MSYRLSGSTLSVFASTVNLRMAAKNLLALSFGAVAVFGQESCPGYSASNVQQSGRSLTADLTLAGEACNSYGTDLPNLTLTVEYQSGKGASNQ